MSETTITITKNESVVTFVQPFIEQPTLKIEVQDTNGYTSTHNGAFATPSNRWFTFDINTTQQDKVTKEEKPVVTFIKSNGKWTGFKIGVMDDASNRNQPNSFDLLCKDEDGKSSVWLKQPTNWRYTATGKIS